MRDKRKIKGKIRKNEPTNKKNKLPRHFSQSFLPLKTKFESREYTKTYLRERKDFLFDIIKKANKILKEEEKNLIKPSKNTKITFNLCPNFYYF